MSVGKKNIILASILCISIITIGVSFAYFTSNTEVKGTGTSVSGKTAELIKVTYDAGSPTTTLENAIPGDTATKYFSIKVEPTENENTVTYAIILDISTNTFSYCNDASMGCELNAEELTYSLKEGENVIASGNLTEITGKQQLAKITKNTSSDITYNYTLEITYVDTQKTQNHNQNKTFTSNILVEFAKAE